MTDKTCGTCARKTDGYCDVTAWAVEDDNECSVPPEFGGMSWTAKTCVTCAHCATAYNGDDSFCRATSRVIFLRRFETDGAQAPCGGVHYDERSDSVEQVARAMLADLACMSAFAPDSAKGAVAAMHYGEFRYRLRALGVV